MAKTLTIIGMMGGVVLLFYFSGLLTDTASSIFLDLLLNPERFQTASTVTKIISAIGILIGISTLVFRNNNGVAIDQYLMIPFIELFLSFGWDFLKVYQQIASVGEVGKVVAILFFGPLMIMYIISLVEWWRGVET